MSQQTKIAVCIATYRRNGPLRALLASLDDLRVPSGCELEVRVVENDDRRHAQGVVWQWSKSSEIPTRYGVEAVQNIARTRNRALDMGEADWFAFVDDDEVVDPCWLERLYERAMQGDVDAVFGNVLPTLPRCAPAWVGQGGFLAKTVTPRLGPAFWRGARTSNALVRGTWLARHRFCPQLGRSGGEDTELFRRMSDHGARFGWAPEAVVREAVLPSQCSLAWLWRRHQRSGRVFEQLSGRRRTASILVAVRRGAMAAMLLAWSTPAWLFGARADAVRACLKLATALGGLQQGIAGRPFDPAAGYQSAGMDA